MTWFARVRSFLRGVVFRGRIEQDMADEMQFHIALRTDDLMRRGVPSADAARQARIEFGGAARYQDECRDSRGLRLFNELRADLLYAARGIRSSPGFAAIVVFSLALGIGANTAMFSIVNGVLLRPLPFRDPGRLVALQEDRPPSMDSMKTFRIPPSTNFLLHRQELGSFEEVIGIDYEAYELVDVEEPQGLAGGGISANFCSALGVMPVIGRCFSPDEEVHRAQVAMISHELWQRQFRGDVGVLDRPVTIRAYRGNRSIRVIGVLPPEFRLDSIKYDIWIPLSETADFRLSMESWNPDLTIAKLRSGVSAGQAQAELQAMQRRVHPTGHEGAGGYAIRVRPYVDYLASRVKTGLVVLLSVVGLVLLITCANVANLLLSRGMARVREIAVRASLGAGRFRIVRQLVTEAVSLAALGAALGLFIAVWILRGVKLLNFRIPRVEDIQIDSTVLAFTAIVAIVSGVLFGLLPAIRLSRVDLADAMKRGGAGAMGGRRQQHVMHALVICEVALCTVAITGAGLLINTFVRLKLVDPGFGVDRILVASLNPPPAKTEASSELFGRILERVQAMPGIEAAALTDNPPPYRVTSIMDFRRPGTADVFGPGGPRANARIVSPQYFRTMGIPLLRGRGFDEHDQTNSRRVVVVSDSLARRYWPEGGAIGQTIVLRDGPPQPAEIIGVVGDVHQRGPREKPDDMLYSTYTQSNRGAQAIIVKTAGDAAALAPALKREIRAIDRDQTFRFVNTMSELMAREVAEPRFYMILLGGYGVLALALTTLGIGGLVAYSVSRRTQEIGLRISFGATRGSLLRMFAGGSLRLLATGLLIGIPGALALTRFMRTLLFEITPSDPATFSLAAILLIAVSLAACTSAALRATAIEPAIVLRHE